MMKKVAYFPILLLTLAAAGSATEVAPAAGGYSSADVPGTWTCHYVYQAQRSMSFTVDMLANGTAVATNVAGSQSNSFKWRYRSTGPSSGVIDDLPGSVNVTWLSHDHVHVNRISQGVGLSMFAFLDCSRG